MVLAQPNTVELSLYPVTPQLNGKFTQHVGTFGAATWRVVDRVGVQILGGGNWFNQYAPLNEELIGKFGLMAPEASSLLWTWGLFVGAELEPARITLSIFNGQELRAGLVVAAGLGAGGTRRSDGRDRYFDTGSRFMGNASLGLRLQLARRFTLRFDVRDVLFSSQVITVNGCNIEGLTAGQCDGLTAESEAAAPVCAP